MIAFFKGKALSQVDIILINGIEYTSTDLAELIKKNKEKDNERQKFLLR